MNLSPESFNIEINWDSLIKEIINYPPINQFIKTLIGVVGGIIFLWIVIKIVSFISSKRIKKRIFLIYDNVLEMKKRLDELEKKVDSILENLGKKQKKKEKKEETKK